LTLRAADARRLCVLAHARASSGRGVAVTLSHWWQILTLYEVILVWPLALATLLFAARSKSRRRQLAGVGVIVLLFTPFIHRWAGDRYFDYLCEHEAGEVIYRTVDNVEGILQMRPRDGSKDYFDRMAAGDIPEDPWGHTNWEAQKPSTMFVNPPWSNYKIFETILVDELVRRPGERETAEASRIEANARFRRYSGYDQKAGRPMRLELVNKASSSYGYTWGASRSWLHEFFNIHPGEIRVLYLESNEVLGMLRGFYRVRPMQICPQGKDNDLVYRFVVRVVRPRK
jgi:hypothetical protein